MSTKSYLLALDGSQESLFAAEISWKLASTNQAKVLAQTVIDSQSLWQIVGKDSPGFIGTGPYLAAHEVIHGTLKNIADTLLNAYEARARGQGIESECVMDEGNVLDEIVRRAKDHLIVVVGHRPARADRKNTRQSWFQSYSLAEHLAYECPRPLLIVQEKCSPWKTARLIISEDTFDSSALAIFNEFANSLQLAQEVYCIAPEESVVQFTKAVSGKIPANQSVRMICQDQGEADPDWECATDVPSSTLLVVATQQGQGGRMTCGGTDLGAFIHQLRWPAVVVLPEPRIRDLVPASEKGKALSKKP